MRSCPMRTLVLILAFLIFNAASFAEKMAPAREAIGKVLGRTIFRDEIMIPEEYRNIDPGLFKKMQATTEQESGPDLEFDIEPENSSESGDLSDFDETDFSEADDEDDAENETVINSPEEYEEFEKSFDKNQSETNTDEDTGNEEDYGEEGYVEDPEEMAWEREKIVQGELMRLFAGPLFAEYAQGLASEIEPTPEEIQAFVADMSEKQNKIMQDEKVARMIIKPWKLQIKLYEQYGGGRILWQQAGFEAFDAMRQFLEEQKKLGRLEITDPQLQETFSNYWSEPGHANFLKSDPETAKQFLHPAWRRP